MKRGILEAGESGGLRRVPIIWHLLIVASLLSMFRILEEPFVDILLILNNRSDFDWTSLAMLLTLTFGYSMILLLLASTKVLVDWLVDGE